MICRAWVCAAVILLLCGCDDKPAAPTNHPASSANSSAAAPVATTRSLATPAFRDVNDTINAFFAAPLPVTTPAAPFNFAGNWQGKFLTVDPGPGTLPVDVSAMPAFAFTLVASGDGYRLTSSEPARQLEMTVSDGGLTSKPTTPPGPTLRLIPRGDALIGETHSAQTSAARTVFRATRLP